MEDTTSQATHSCQVLLVKFLASQWPVCIGGSVGWQDTPNCPLTLTTKWEPMATMSLGQTQAMRGERSVGLAFSCSDQLV